MRKKDQEKAKNHKKSFTSFIYQFNLSRECSRCYDNAISLHE